MAQKARRQSSAKIPATVKKFRKYEAFKRYLLLLALTPEEYEQRIRAYCQRNGI